MNTVVNNINCYDMTREYSSRLNTLQSKIDLYVSNGVSVPARLQQEFDSTYTKFIEVSNMCLADFFSPERVDSLNEYKKSLPEKVSAIVGPLSDIPRASLTQCMSASLILFKKFIESELTDAKCVCNIDYMFSYMRHYCDREYLKLDNFKRDNFDYTGYILRVRDLSLKDIVIELISNIEKLLSSVTDDDFYFYFELIDMGMGCYSSIIPDEFYF